MLNSAGKQQPGKGAIETLPSALAQLVLGPLSSPSRGASGFKCTHPALQNSEPVFWCTENSTLLYKSRLASWNSSVPKVCQMTSSSVIGIVYRRNAHLLQQSQSRSGRGGHSLFIDPSETIYIIPTSSKKILKSHKIKAAFLLFYRGVYTNSSTDLLKSRRG